MRYRDAVLAAIAFAAIGVEPALGEDVRLNGLWLHPRNGTVLLEHDGQQVIGSYANPDQEMQDDYGYRPGERFLSGSFDGQRLIARVQQRLPLRVQEICGDRWRREIDIVLELSPDGNTLRGTSTRQFMTAECKPAEIRRDDYILRRAPRLIN